MRAARERRRAELVGARMLGPAVRELDFVPESLRRDRTTLVSQSTLTSYINLDFHLLQYLTR